jgi:hypothetical protein
VSKLLNLLSVEFMERVGRKRVLLKELQKIQGLIVFCSRVSRGLKFTLPYQYQVNASNSEKWVDPVGDERTAKRCWREYREALELARLLALDSERFKASCTSFIAEALTLGERIWLRERMWVQMPQRGGGAALAVVDYTAGMWAAQEVGEKIKCIRRARGGYRQKPGWHRQSCCRWWH